MPSRLLPQHAPRSAHHLQTTRGAPHEVVRAHGAVQAGTDQRMAGGQEGHGRDGRGVLRERDEAKAAGQLEELDLHGGVGVEGGVRNEEQGGRAQVS